MNVLVKGVRLSLRGLIVAFGLVALVLPIGLIGLFQVLQLLNDINRDVAIVRNAQLDAAEILRAQIEEESGIRAYTATHDPRELRAYQIERRSFDEHVDALGHKMIFGGKTDTVERVALDRAVALDRTWRREVADPIVAGSRENRVLYGSGRTLIARFRALMLGEVADDLTSDYHMLLANRSRAIRSASYIGYGAIAVVGIEILAFTIILTRLRSDLDRERAVAEALQTGFAVNTRSIAHLDVATHYLSAIDGARVGGDAYDIFALDEHRYLIAIADVSGKGVDAAIDALFVRHALRAFASEYTDVGTIVTRFNALFFASGRKPESFVELFAAIFDARTNALDYVNAGHEPVYVLRAGTVSSLAPTGPLIGIISDERFAAASRRLASDELVFLATDGLTEARNAAGMFLTDAGVRRWLCEADGSSPASVVGEITARLRTYTRKAERDDLAIVAFCMRSNSA